MPDREFDFYLSVLSRLLRLQPGQREEIADELRDHLEERLAELTAAGVSRDDAVRRALEEFGDAAGLAADFKHISRLRHRRTLMRWTVSTIAVTAAAIFLATAFWPDQPGAPAPHRAKAQGFGGEGVGGPPLGTIKRVTRTVSRTPDAELDKKLSTKLEKVEWVDAAVKDVVQMIAAKIKADIVFDKKHFSDNDYDLSTPVSLRLAFTKITARTALEMVLERAEFADVAVTYRDGLIYLTGRSNDRHIEVYDCGDLLKATATKPIRGAGVAGPDGAGEGGGAPGVPFGPMGPMGGLGGIAPGGGGTPRHRASTPAARQLIDVIQTTVRSTTWREFDGGGASIAEFNGLLVVTAGHMAHRDIKLLLDKMRGAVVPKK